MGGQTFPLPLRESVGAAAPETASADLDSRLDQPRDGEMVRCAEVAVRRARHDAQADARNVGPLYLGSGEARIPGGPGEFRLPATDLRPRNRREGRRTRPQLSLRRRLRQLCAARMDVPSGLQFARGDAPARDPLLESKSSPQHAPPPPFPLNYHITPP